MVAVREIDVARSVTVIVCSVYGILRKSLVVNFRIKPRLSVEECPTVRSD